MPGMLLDSFRGGSRSEYLAQFLLSTLGVSVQVPRQEDIGADFYCSLARLDGMKLTFEASYIVQLKSTPISGVSYGGPDVKGVRRSEEVRWLFSQEFPMLLGFVDKKALCIHLYTTSNMWLAFYLSGGPGEVVLEPAKPDVRIYDVQYPSKEDVTEWPQGIGDGLRWRVPLGPPILSFTADEAEDKSKVAYARERLLPFLQAEQANIGYRRLKIHYSRTPYIVEASEEGLQTVGYYVAFVGNKTPGANVDDQLLSIAPALGTLAFNLKEQGRFDDLRRLQPIAMMVPDSQEREVMLENFPELFG